MDSPSWNFDDFPPPALRNPEVAMDDQSVDMSVKSEPLDIEEGFTAIAEDTSESPKEPHATSWSSNNRLSSNEDLKQPFFPICSQVISGEESSSRGGDNLATVQQELLKTKSEKQKGLEYIGKMEVERYKMEREIEQLHRQLEECCLNKTQSDARAKEAEEKVAMLQAEITNISQLVETEKKSNSVYGEPTCTNTEVKVEYLVIMQTNELKAKLKQTEQELATNLQILECRDLRITTLEKEINSKQILAEQKETEAELKLKEAFEQISVLQCKLDGYITREGDVKTKHKKTNAKQKLAQSSSQNTSDQKVTSGTASQNFSTYQAKHKKYEISPDLVVEKLKNDMATLQDSMNQLQSRHCVIRNREQEARDKLKEKCVVAYKEIETLKSKLELSQSKENKLKLKLSKLKNTLNTQKKNLLDLQTLLASSQAEFSSSQNSHEKDRVEAEQRISGLQSALESNHVQLGLLEKKLSSTQILEQQAVADLNTSEAKLKTLQEEYFSLQLVSNDKVDKINSKLNCAKETVASLLDKISKLDSRDQESSSRVTQSDGRWAVLQRDYNTLQALYKSSRGSEKEAVAHTEQMEKQMKRLESKLTSSKAREQIMITNLTEKEENVATLQGKIEILRMKVTKLQGKIEFLESTLASVEAREQKAIFKSEKKLETMRAVLVNAREAQQESISCLQVEKSTSGRIVSELEGKLATLQKKVTSLKSELAATLAAKVKAENEVAQQVENLKQRLQTNKNKYKAKISQLKLNLSKENQNLATLQAEYSTLSQELENLQQKNLMVSQKMIILHEQFSRLQKKMSKLKEKNVKKKRHCKNLERMLSSSELMQGRLGQNEGEK